MSDEPKVIALDLAPPISMDENASPELVATLAKLLRDAEQGRVVSIAVAAIVYDEDGDRASRTAFVAPGGADAEWMTGVIETIKFRLMRHSLDLATAPADWPRAPDGAA